jgi:4-hydroxybenzoate polyprenyltransferase
LLAKVVLRSRSNWLDALNRVRFEARLSWLFMRRDISATIVPSLMFLAAAGLSRHLGATELLLALAAGTLYSWLYCYVFCLSNQIEGLEEDRLNKPDRPLPSGLVSVRGAHLRWALMMIAFALVGWWFGVLEWAVLWGGVVVLHNYGGWAKHWFTKNLSMLLGVVAELAAAWEIVTPLTPVAWRWIGVLAIAVFSLASLQDLRDIEGDRANRRRTLPLVIGVDPTRWVLGAGFAILPVIIHVMLMQPAGLSWNVVLCDIGLALVSLTIALRVVFYRTQPDDHQTYMLFTYWYCLALLSAAIVL